ncbi:hypothetical protein EDD18DRAFT_1388737 [Armillaria luteobubalina]|uniref:F-box domain-containing protein n=1 Tax=Armillaria luteobubalina TaxID=153913 RepID=A0AA39Q5E0_9AGAR|nr:hypothetical protein EDD18DRAFT_1388737 [Armillaria luteobubalina]
MTEIPAELVDVILEYLRDDTETMRTCNLVSKYWLQSSRRHSFRVIVTAANQRQFIQLCANTNTFIPHTLRNIDFVLESQPEAFSPRPRILSGPAGYNLCTHKVRKVGTKSIHVVLDFITSFPHLQSLSICDTSWTDPHEDICVSPINLDHLILCDCCQRDIFDWLYSLESIPLVPHINLGYSVRPADTQSIGRYLSHLEETLQALSFGFSSFDAGGDAEDFYLSVDLGLNTALRHLRIDYFISNTEVSQVTSAGPWIVKILHQLNSAALGMVDLGIAPWLADGLDVQDEPIDWVDLDRLFSGRLAGVRLRFLVYGHARFEQVCTGLKARLASCCQRGNLLIERSTPPFPPR